MILHSTVAKGGEDVRKPTLKSYVEVIRVKDSQNLLVACFLLSYKLELLRRHKHGKFSLPIATVCVKLAPHAFWLTCKTGKHTLAVVARETIHGTHKQRYIHHSRPVSQLTSSNQANSPIPLCLRITSPVFVLRVT